MAKVSNFDIFGVNGLFLVMILAVIGVTSFTIWMLSRE